MTDFRFHKGFDISSATVDSVLGSGGHFERQIPGFIPRKGQLRLAAAVHDSIRDGALLIAEAATGTGKTYAYLVPALLSRRTTVISTASKALQDQLIKNDLPRLYKLLNLEPDYMVLKGFNNYLCLTKFEHFCKNFKDDLGIGADEAEQARINRVIAQLEVLVAKTGRQIEFNDPECGFCDIFGRFPQDIVNRLVTDHRLCSSTCHNAARCFPKLARQKAAASRVVIINHQLFFADLEVDDNFNPLRPPFMLPRYSLLIFDEAYRLPEIGREFMSEKIGTMQLKTLSTQIDFVMRCESLTCQSGLREGMVKLKEAFKGMTDYLNDKGLRGGRINFLQLLYKDFHQNDSIFADYTQKDEDFREEAIKLYQALRNYREFIHSVVEESELLQLPESMVKTMEKTLVTLMKIDDKSNGAVYGSHVGTAAVFKKGFEFSLCPLEISEPFGNFLNTCRQYQCPVIMTAATLSVAGRFDKFNRDIGAPEGTAAVTVESHFDYARHALCLMSKDFPVPDPNTEGREELILNTLEPLFSATDGGIFILTTSISALESYAAAALRHIKGRTILVQNQGLSNIDLLTRFKKDGRAVLVGTSSFWAGVDVPGPALSLVIIDKLPFVHHEEPLFKARCERYDREHGTERYQKPSFHAISLPEAVITLRQGAGRLIRQDDDAGVLVICDPRIKTAPYGKSFIKSLPNMKSCSKVDEAADFLNSLRKDPAGLDSAKGAGKA